MLDSLSGYLVIEYRLLHTFYLEHFSQVTSNLEFRERHRHRPIATVKWARGVGHCPLLDLTTNFHFPTSMAQLKTRRNSYWLSNLNHSIIQIHPAVIRGFLRLARCSWEVNGAGVNEQCSCPSAASPACVVFLVVPVDDSPGWIIQAIDGKF